MSRRLNKAASALLSLAGLACSVWPMAAIAHSGGLNAEGCHNDRRNGGYHCHRGGGSRSAPSSRQGFSSAPSGGRAFANCSAARAAGATPVRRGDPGYGPHLDRDGDGVGCERG
ncbi:excalibur calcium-binding domain-containing protein [Brevundimonas sp. 374]|uniref:excalibur calcium-binding domain-containing protein n=1 Tax=Brevundimonas sp. 374 TaxID=1150400 RepID=UPI000B843A15